MKMRKEILKALKGSVKKWEQIVRSPKGEDNASDNCPLCMISDEDCLDCPVSQEVGDTDCDSTPYELWVRHQLYDHKRSFPLTRVPHCRRCLNLAREERDLLVSLLPASERKQ